MKPWILIRSYLAFVLPTKHTLTHGYTHTCVNTRTQWCKSFNWLVCTSIGAVISLWVISQLLCFLCVCVCSVFWRSSISCARKLSLFFDFQLERETTSLSAFICHLLFFLSIPPPLSSPFHSLLFVFSQFLFYVSPSVSPPLSSVIRYSLHFVLVHIWEHVMWFDPDLRFCLATWWLHLLLITGCWIPCVSHATCQVVHRLTRPPISPPQWMTIGP